MRKALLVTAASLATLATAVGAQAADLPMPQVVPYVPPAFNWTGFYLGGHFGGARLQRDWTDSLFGISSTGGTRDVLVAGTQAGANFQMGHIVLGVEWDVDFASNHSNHDNGVLFPTLGANIHVTSHSRWSTTLAARFGVALDRVLIYGKAGGGWVSNNGLTITNVATGASIGGSNNLTSGWLVGGGIEWAFGTFINGWTMRLEYDYLGLGSWSYTVPAAAPFLAGDTFTATRDVQMVKLGFNYLFNAPMRSRYY